MPGTGPVATGMLAIAMDRSPAIPRSARSPGAKYRTGVYLSTGADQTQLLSVIRAQPSAAAESVRLGQAFSRKVSCTQNMRF